MKIVSKFPSALAVLLVVAGCSIDDAPSGTGGSQLGGSAQTAGTAGIQIAGAGGTQTSGTGGGAATGGASARGGANDGASDAAVVTRDADASTGRVDARVDTGTREADSAQSSDARGNAAACGLSGQTNPPAGITTCNCGGVEGNGADSNRCIRVENRCADPIRFHASGSDAPANALNGQVASLAPGGCNSYTLTRFASGRLWAETCPGGACAPGPYTLSEFTLGATGVGTDFDYYDLSLVDGYNVAMAIRPVPGTFAPGNGKYSCGTPLCSCEDILTNCPAELRANSSTGKVGLCKSGCAATGQAQYCCQGTYNTPATCPSTPYSAFFKTRCPDAYSYAFDDQASTYTCGSAAQRPDYDIIFCP
jgi:hypothetical protein